MPDFTPSRLLIRVPNWVGDAVMALPALRAVRERFPGAEIVLLALPWVADLFARENFADRVIVYDAARGPRDFARKWRLARSLRADGFDAALLLTNSFDSAAVVRLAGIPFRAGFARDGRGWLLTHPAKVPPRASLPNHHAYYYLRLLQQLGWVETLPDATTVRLRGWDQARAAGEERFRLLGVAPPVIGVSPGAAYGGAKRWPVERFHSAAEILARDLRATVVLFGTSGERALCESLTSSLAASGVAVTNLAGRTTLAEFIEFAAACKVFLTNDSGSMHIAAALGLPTVAIFGATDHIATAPMGDQARIVRRPVDCSPHPNPCMLRECPIDHRCMAAVSPEEVAETALTLLK